MIRPTQPDWLSPLCIVHALWYLDCTDLSTYFTYLLIVKQVYNGSVINEVFSTCIVYILGYFGLYGHISRTGSSQPIQQEWLYSERDQNNITPLYLECEQVYFVWMSRSLEVIYSWYFLEKFALFTWVLG